MVRRIGRRWAPVTLRKRAAAPAKALSARPRPLAKEAEGTVRGFRRWQLILICLAAGCSSMPPPPTATPAAPRAAYLGDVIRMHGWPCEGVTDFHASAPQWTSVTCRDGQTYEVFLRADADWRAGERQTRLQPMLELGNQTKLPRTGFLLDLVAARTTFSVPITLVCQHRSGLRSPHCTRDIAARWMMASTS
jgi:hypothetical protein